MNVLLLSADMFHLLCVDWHTHWLEGNDLMWDTSFERREFAAQGGRLTYWRGRYEKRVRETMLTRVTGHKKSVVKKDDGNYRLEEDDVNGLVVD